LYEFVPCREVSPLQTGVPPKHAPALMAVTTEECRRYDDAGSPIRDRTTNPFQLAAATTEKRAPLKDQADRRHQSSDIPPPGDASGRTRFLIRLYRPKKTSTTVRIRTPTCSSGYAPIKGYQSRINGNSRRAMMRRSIPQRQNRQLGSIPSFDLPQGDAGAEMSRANSGHIRRLRLKLISSIIDCQHRRAPMRTLVSLRIFRGSQNRAPARPYSGSATRMKERRIPGRLGPIFTTSKSAASPRSCLYIKKNSHPTTFHFEDVTPAGRQWSRCHHLKLVVGQASSAGRSTVRDASTSLSTARFRNLVAKKTSSRFAIRSGSSSPAPRRSSPPRPSCHRWSPNSPCTPPGKCRSAVKCFSS